MKSRVSPAAVIRKVKCLHWGCPLDKLLLTFSETLYTCISTQPHILYISNLSLCNSDNAPKSKLTAEQQKLTCLTAYLLKSASRSSLSLRVGRKGPDVHLSLVSVSQAGCCWWRPPTPRPSPPSLEIYVPEPSWWNRQLEHTLQKRFN